MNSKWYWLIRQKYRNLKFQIKKAAFRLNERKESSERLSSFSRIVIRTLLVQVAINLVLVAVLYVGDKLLLSAMEIFAKTQTDPLIAALSESILVDIVIGGIGVAGVILGLYCSNMTSVYSSKYTNAPATISSAFQRDVVTNRCIKQITGYIIFCVIILFGCLIGSVVDLQEKILPACIACAKSDDKNHVILAAAIADVFIGIYINIIIGINKYLRELNIDSLLNCATEAYSYEQLKPNNRYYNNHSVEHLFNCIFAELKLESKRVTPDWYIKQAVAYTVYQDLNDVVDAMDKIYNNVFSVGKRLTENKCYLQGATVLSRLFELSSKASMALTSLNTFFPKLEALHFEPTVVWDECHLKQFLTRRKEIEKRFPPYLVKCCGETTLAHWRDREDFPDSLGFCYNQLCEYLVVAIEDDDFESFKSAYSGFFGVVLLYHEYVRSDVVKIKELHKQSAVFHVVTAPLIEYAIISGLAILWGEFSENRQWKELVDAELSEFVSKDEKKREILTKIIEMLSYRKGHMLGIGNRDLIQTNWVQRITNSIRVSGLCHYEYKDWGIKVLKTESTLLKAFCGTSFENLGFADNVEDLYLILCLNQYVPSEKQYESRSKWEKNLHETDTQ